MQWDDEGIIIGRKPYGENSAILTILTHQHGKACGFVRFSRKKFQGVLEVGNRVSCAWRARLEDQLGSFSCELLHAYSASVLVKPMQLLALTSAMELLRLVLAEHDAHPLLYTASISLLETLGHDEDWYRAYVDWEVFVLRELGFELSFHECAFTRATAGLAYVSPRTGKAATAEAVLGIEDKLLAMPGALSDSSMPYTQETFAQALKITAHFLHKWALSPQGYGMPEARGRFIARLKVI